MSYEGKPVAADVFEISSMPAATGPEDHDKPQEECGVFAIYAPGEAVLKTTVDGMLALQHRGHSGAGIAYINNARPPINGAPPQLMIHNGKGRVAEAIPEIYSPLDTRPGRVNLNRIDDFVHSDTAIGHTRYSTAESEDRKALQPILGIETNIAVAHNGHIDNMVEVALKHDIDPEGAASDSALLTKVLDEKSLQLGSLEEAMRSVLPDINGAYCLTIIDGERVLAARDAWGFRPLALGVLPEGKGYVVASEEYALQKVGAEVVRDIAPGEIVVIDKDGVSSSTIDRQEDPQLCAFELIYTAKPEGIVDGVSVVEARRNLGRHSAEDHPADADLVVAVPDSGTPAAEGYAEVSGIPLLTGILKDKNAPRTFQMRGDERTEAIKAKYQMVLMLLADKRIVLVDDSVIKGNTMRELVHVLKEDYGVREVHIRLSSPRYENPCLMGMDTHNTDLLIARHLTDEQIARELGADSIAFNTPERVQQSADEARIRPLVGRQTGKLCMSCATNEYPFTPAEAQPAKQVHLGMPVLGHQALVGAGV